MKDVKISLDNDHDIARDCRQSKFMIAVWLQQHERCVAMSAWRTVIVSQSENVISIRRRICCSARI